MIERGCESLIGFGRLNFHRLNEPCGRSTRTYTKHDGVFRINDIVDARWSATTWSSSKSSCWGCVLEGEVLINAGHLALNLILFFPAESGSPSITFLFRRSHTVKTVFSWQNKHLSAPFMKTFRKKGHHATGNWDLQFTEAILMELWLIYSKPFQDLEGCSMHSLDWDVLDHVRVILVPQRKNKRRKKKEAPIENGTIGNSE